MVREGNLKSIATAATVWLLGLGYTEAQTLSDKLCGVAVAQKLPNVPGASVTSLSFKPLDKRQALNRITGKYSLQAAANELDRAFSFIDARMMKMVEYPYAAGGPEKVRADLVDAALKVVSDAVEVNAEYQLAGIRIMYAGSCARGTSGGMSAVLDGAQR